MYMHVCKCVCVYVFTRAKNYTVTGARISRVRFLFPISLASLSYLKEFIDVTNRVKLKMKSSDLRKYRTKYKKTAFMGPDVNG